MGLFFNVGIVKNCDSKKAECYLREWVGTNTTDIITKECKIEEQNESVLIELNGYGVDGEEFFKYVSKKNNDAVMYLYIHDGDFWGYFLYDKGEEIDFFNPIPDYFGEDIEDIEKYKGNVDIIVKYFNVNKEDVEKFLVIWPEEDEYDEDCDDEECQYYFDEWGFVDFMKALGYEYRDE